MPLPPTTGRTEVVKTIKWWLHTGYVGAEHNGEIVVEDDATDEEIDEAVKEDMFNYLDWGWQGVIGND